MRLLLLTLAVLSVPLDASADSVALFIHETQFGASDTEAVALAMAAAVEEAGGTPVWLTDPDDIRSANQALEGSCPIECFDHFASALGVQQVFSASIWRLDSGASIGMAFRAHNRRHSISSVITDFSPASVREGIRSGHHQLRRWDAGHAPVLRVVTDPPGAAVIARGQPLGMTPLELPASPGDVTLTISLTGYEPVRHTVTVPMEDEANVELTLTPVAGQSRQAPASRSLLPGILMAATGGLGVATAIGTSIVDRCATADAGGYCTERRMGNAPRAAIYGVASGVLLVGGVVWAVRARNHNERATEVRVGLGSVEIRGRF